MYKRQAIKPEEEGTTTSKMAELTEGSKMDRLIEKFQQIMKKMEEDRDEERRERKEHHKFIIEKLDEMNKKMEEDNRRWREEMREDRLKREEIPNDKTQEQVVVLPGIEPNGNKENIKQRKRRMYPRNVIKTKEELEMMNHGLTDGNNCLLYTSRCV